MSTWYDCPGCGDTPGYHDERGEVCCTHCDTPIDLGTRYEAYEVVDGMVMHPLVAEQYRSHPAIVNRVQQVSDPRAHPEEA